MNDRALAPSDVPGRDGVRSRSGDKDDLLRRRVEIKSQVDFDRIKTLLQGREPTCKRVTAKSVVVGSLSEIRSALRRGLTYEEVTGCLREGGVEITESTLRKYLYLHEVEKEKKATKRTRTPEKSEPVVVGGSARPVGTSSTVTLDPSRNLMPTERPAEPIRRSLKRGALLSSAESQIRKDAK